MLSPKVKTSEAQLTCSPTAHVSELLQDTAFVCLLLLNRFAGPQLFRARGDGPWRVFVNDSVATLLQQTSRGTREGTAPLVARVGLAAPGLLAAPAS